MSVNGSTSAYISSCVGTQQLIWIDSEAFDQAIEIANQCLHTDRETAIQALEYATSLYAGTFLPNRIFEDWSSLERERLQLLAINAMISLGELKLESNPTESIRLAQEALLIDAACEVSKSRFKS